MRISFARRFHFVNAVVVGRGCESLNARVLEALCDDVGERESRELEESLGTLTLYTDKQDRSGLLLPLLPCKI